MTKQAAENLTEEIVIDDINTEDPNLNIEVNEEVQIKDLEPGEDKKVEDKPKSIDDYMTEVASKTQAIEEERVSHRATQARMEKLESTFQQFMAYTQRGQTQQAQGPQQNQRPNPDEDPMGYIKWIGEQMEQNNQNIDLQQQQYQEQAQQQQILQQQTQQNIEFARDFEDNFRKVAPDYDTALTHLKQSRERELTMMGANPQQIASTILHETNAVLNNCKNSGQNPALVFYQSAVGRGYVPNTASTPQQDSRTPQTRVDKMIKAAAVTDSLSSGGASSPRTVSLADLADLPGDQFDQVMEKILSN